MTLFKWAFDVEPHHFAGVTFSFHDLLLGSCLTIAIDMLSSHLLFSNSLKSFQKKNVIYEYMY